MDAYLTVPVKVGILSAITAAALFEYYRSKKAGLQLYNLKETLSNITIAAGQQTVKALTLGWQILVLSVAAGYAPHKMPETLPVFLLSFFLADFLYYWQHRVMHEIPFFWAFHLVHHSSPWMNLTTSFRLNWFTPLIAPFFYLPAALIGIPIKFIGLALVLNLLYQFWLHTQLIGKLGFLEGIINTPSAHRVHHGSNEIYLDKNYGGVLSIWDRMFGSYVPETEPVVYGITTGFVSHNPIKLVVHGFIDLARGRLKYKG